MNFEGVAVLHLELETVIGQHIQTLLFNPRRRFTPGRRVVRGGNTNRIRCVRGLDSRAVEEEAHGASSLALAFAEGAHQFLELGGALDLEEDLVVVVCHLDVKVFRVRRGLLAGCAVCVVVGHCYRFVRGLILRVLCYSNNVSGGAE